MKAFFRKITIFLLTGVMLLSGCKKVPEVIAAPTPSQAAPRPALQVVTSGSVTLPEVTVWENASTMNTAFAAFFRPLNESLEKAFASGLEGEIEYRFAKGVERYYLQCNLALPDGTLHTLATVVIAEDGSYELPQSLNLVAYEDGGYLQAKFALEAMGIQVDDARYGQTMTVRALAEILVACAEAVYGEAIDPTGVYTGEDSSYDDPMFQKAIKLGILQAEDAWSFFEGDVPVMPEQLLQMVLAVSQKLEQEVFLRYGEDATYQELTEIIDFCMMLLGVQTTAWTYTEPTHPVTRLDVAALLVAHYEESFGTIQSRSALEDTDALAAQKADSIGLMSSFPCYRFFSPDYRPKQHDLYGIAQQYANQYFWSLEGANNEALTYEQTMERVSAWLRTYAERTAPTTTVETVDNGKSYDWYFNQLDGTPYQYVNCMPSISSMAIKWCYRNADIEPDILRQKFLPAYQDGWYMWQVEECLNDYNVAYEVHYTTSGAYVMDSPEDYQYAIQYIMDELDKGNIILTQMTEADPLVSGHCMVIYGYIRFGESVIFIVNDSDYGWQKNIYGEPAGKGAQLDSNYALFIMRRQTNAFLSVSGPKR